MEELHKLLIPGQLVRIVDSSKNSWHFGVKCPVEDNQILCDLLDRSREAPPRDAKDLELIISTTFGVYQVRVYVAEISLDGSEYQLNLDKKFKYTQRRKSYRLKSPSIEASCTVNDEPLEKVKVTDISVGGIGLLADRERPFKKDALLKLELILHNGTTLNVKARVVYVAEHKEEEGYLIGASFTRLSHADEAKIMQTIFHEQLKRRRSEMEEEF